MSWLFGCFRRKHSNPNLVNPPVFEPEHVVFRSKNALSSLFHSDEDEPLGKGEQGQNELTEVLYGKELKEEAKFLKACGTLPGTPVEIRKDLDRWESKSYSLVDSPSSCITDEHHQNTRSDAHTVISPKDMRDNEFVSETSAVSCQVFAPSVQCKSKSVRFDCELESSAFSSKGSSSECESQHMQKSGSEGHRSVTKPSGPSPYPTPLKLTDEMQTPGTVFPAHTDDMAENKIEALKLDYEDDVMSTTMAQSTVKQFSAGKEKKNEASMSDWLKPASPKINQVYRKSPGDRPILGMVASHWNDAETSHVSPKWWDGNGIPNSTNKYKEDQKVSWHATPFEERLEKALSEETFVSQRKPIGQTPRFDFNESEESDTTLSHLQSSDHIKPVVSF